MLLPLSKVENILTPRDLLLTVPRLRDVKAGDVLALDEIHELGSREYTLCGNPVIPQNRVKVDATVVEHQRKHGVYSQKEKEKRL